MRSPPGRDNTAYATGARGTVGVMGRMYLTLNEVREETGLTAPELKRLIDAGVIRLVHGKRSGQRIARTELRKLDGLVLTPIPPAPPAT